MIECHVFNTFLAAAFRDTGWFSRLNYVNGLVAPSFLFIAGFVQGMERWNGSGKPIDYGRRTRRLLGIAAIGYALHFPIGPIYESHWDDAVRIGSQIDVLQCLAAGLGLLLGVQFLAEKCRRATASAKVESAVWLLGVVGIGAAVVLAAPAVQGWMGAPAPLRAWVNFTTGSLFPLFPWIGFVLFGALAGAWWQRPVWQRALGLAGLAALAWACRGTTFTAFDPPFFLERAVWVLILAVGCEWISQRFQPGLLLYAGKHSLKLYVIHLVLITTLVGFGIPTMALEVPITAGLLLGVGALSVGLSWLFHWLPQLLPTRRPAAAQAEVLPPVVADPGV